MKKLNELIQEVLNFEGESINKDILYIKLINVKKEITEQLTLTNFSDQKGLLIAFGEKVQGDIIKSDKSRTVEDSYEEFKSNL